MSRTDTALSLFALLGAVVLSGARAEETGPMPSWEIVPETERSVSEESLAPILRFAEEQNTSALLVVKDGRLETEHYFGDAKADEAQHLASAAKSVTSLLPALETAMVRFGSNPKFTPSGQKFVPELLRRYLAALPPPRENAEVVLQESFESERTHDWFRGLGTWTARARVSTSSEKRSLWNRLLPRQTVIFSESSPPGGTGGKAENDFLPLGAYAIRSVISP